MAMAETTRQPSDAAPEADLSGRQLGDYRLLRRLGRGAMAEVYLAQQCSLQRQVALKVLRSDLATDATYIRRFELEAQAAASLADAHIVQIHEVGCVDGVRYIAQEYVAGQNLREFLVRHGPPDVKLALRIMRQVAIALSKAAERGIVHRDIKPENIMLGRGGEVKVADFGLARLSGDSAAVNLTQVGMTMGTPLYMSPEQVEGKPLDPRSDLYSFGVTCYHMLTGAPPFRGETALSVALAHIKQQPERLENLRPDLPSALCRIVHKMLAKEPAQRYAAPRELLLDLRRLSGDSATEDDSEELAALSESNVGPWDAARTAATQRLDALMKTSSLAVPRRRPYLFAASVLVAFLLGAAAALVAGGRFLLAGVKPAHAQIPRQASAESQWLLAMRSNSQAAWQSVVEYFPDNDFYVWHARQQLARIYLDQERYDQALVEFEALANLDESEPRPKAFGLAGKCIVLHLQGKHEASAQAADELAPLAEELTDREIEQWLYQAMAANRRALKRESADELEKKLEAKLRDADG